MQNNSLNNSQNVKSSIGIIFEPDCVHMKSSILLSNQGTNEHSLHESELSFNINI